MPCKCEGCEAPERIRDMAADLKILSRDSEEMRHTLYGNGQPGMKAAVQDLAHETRQLRADYQAAQDIGMKWKLLIAGAFASPIVAVIIERITR